MENKIALIDMDSVAYSIGVGNKIFLGNDEFGIPIYQKEGNKLVYIDKTDDELKASADFMMNDIMSRGNFTHYLAFIKGKNTIASKLAINPEYKQDRSKESPKWWNFVKQDLIDRYGIIEANNYEVDEYVLSAAKEIPNSYICAIDSDILGCEGTHFNWRKNEWITTTKEQEELKFWQEMITGTHNGIKGLPGRGVKYFEYISQDITFLDVKFLGHEVFGAYLEYYKYDYPKAIDNFYKNFKMIDLKKDLDVSMHIPIEWKRDVISDLEFDID